MSLGSSVPPARSYDFSKPGPGAYGDNPRLRERPRYGEKERRGGPGKLPTMGKLYPIKDEPWEAQRAGAAPSAVSLTENDLSPDQKAVFGELVKWVDGGHRDTPLLTLGGFAGTGKTTVLGLLGKRLRKSGRRISYATFMGKASLVLKHKLQDHGAYEDNEGSSCGTLHRLMYRPIVDEKTGEVEGWEPVESIESDIVVVDEASMVDEVMYEQLASYGVPILAVGDHGQLPPIRGNGFNLMGDPMLRLEKIHRQAEGNPILWLSAYVREEGHLPSRLPDDPRVKYVQPRPGWLAKNCGYDKLEDAGCAVVLAGTNDMRARINYAMRSAFGLPEGGPVPGDMLIVLKNAMFDGEQWVYNGQRATLRDRRPRNVGRAHFPATVDFLDERLRGETNLNIAQFGRAGTFKSFEELAALGYPVRSWFAAGLLADYGYALTVHKSQGSSWKHVVIMPEKMGSADDWRRWLYTSITRSSDSLTIAINGA